jgi:hypothetical protein
VRRLIPALIALLVAWVLPGCAALRPRPEDPGLSLLPPSEAGFTRTLTQAVTVRRGDRSIQTTVVAELGRDADRLVVLGPLGSRVLTLVWDGRHLSQTRSPELPDDFPGELVLRDLQLCYWSPESIRKALPGGWSLALAPGTRSVLHEGRPVIDIRFQGDRFLAPISLTHRTLGYALSIRQEAP